MIPFRARHVPLINPGVEDWQMGLYLAAERSGRGYTACLLGDPIGCAGVWIDGKEGRVFAEFSPLIKAMPVQLYKAVKKGLAEIIEETRPECFYTLVDPKDPAAVRFMTHLGFTPGMQMYEKRFT